MLRAVPVLLATLAASAAGYDDDGSADAGGRSAGVLATTDSPTAAAGSGSGTSPTASPAAGSGGNASAGSGTGAAGSAAGAGASAPAGGSAADASGSAEAAAHGSGSGECPTNSTDGKTCFVSTTTGQCLRSAISEHDTCNLVSKDGYRVCELQTTCPCHEHLHKHDPPYNIMTLTGMMAVGNLCRHWGSRPPLSFLPYTVQLFLLGAGWGWLCRGVGGAMKHYEHLSEIDPHLMFYIFLPLLIFESAFATEYHVFKKVVVHCLFLAGPGLIVCAALTAIVAKFAFNAYQWSWVTCLLFGCMLSATDPVAVVALLKELGAAPTISALIEGESLLNDGTAIVFFNIFKSGVASGRIDMTIGEILLELVKVAGGGPIVGLVIGVITKTSIKYTFNDPAIEITLTLVAAYATFFLAEGYFEVSGVLGLVILGMYLAYHAHVISPEVEHSLHQFWEIIVYIANTFIFAIAGLIIAEKAFDAVSARDYGYLAVLYVAVNLIRGFSLFLQRGFMNKLGHYQLDKANGVLCTWGGLRGAVGLALALIVLGDAEILCAFPELGSRFLFHTAGIVALTLMVNGVSTGAVVGRLGLSSVSHSKKVAMQSAFKALMLHCEHQQIELRRQPVFRDAHWSVVQENCVRGMADPHNEPGVAVPFMDIQEDACEHYYRAYATAVEHEYEAGTMRAASQRRLLAYLADAEDKAHVHDLWEMIQAKVLEGLFVVTWKETVPFFGGINAKFVHAFDVCIGFLNAHHFILNNIHLMCHRQQAASRVKDHCKRVRNETLELVARISQEHPEISMAIKSTNASRNVLNAMRNTVRANNVAGKIVQADANALRAMVEKAMDRLRKIPRKLNPAFPEQILCQLCPWYSKIPEVHERLQLLFSLESLDKGDAIVGQYKERSGVWVTLSGVAVVSIGSRNENFGPGYSAGLLGLLTDKDGRYSEVYAATKCFVAYFPELSMRTLMKEYPDFNNLLWDEACRGAARCILSVLAQYRDWDHVRIANFVRKGYRVQVPEAKMYPIQLPPLHVCILVNGSWKDTLMGHSTGEGPCNIPKHFQDVFCWDAPVLFAVPNPLKVSELARQHWKKITNSLFVARAVATLQGHEAGVRAVREVLAGRFFKLIAEAKLEDAPGAEEWRLRQSQQNGDRPGAPPTPITNRVPATGSSFGRPGATGFNTPRALTSSFSSNPRGQQGPYPRSGLAPPQRRSSIPRGHDDVGGSPGGYARATAAGRWNSDETRGAGGVPLSPRSSHAHGASESTPWFSQSPGGQQAHASARRSRRAGNSSGGLEGPLLEARRSPPQAVRPSGRPKETNMRI
eukprot:TRINITY_DN2433_c1_g2_i1.p1 TRINITY_DN2433_c1_g2~~TRINITY_DN2433_c1_g2_i1.p1  ORF type:complete len:1330 (+),score=417.85 TRINITY_DN2433_c1_g2_i1:56-3991(+)